jgi:hypothetical protein
MKTAFISYVFGNDHAVINFGTFKMMASFNRFHPDIPLYMLTEKEINKEVQTVVPMSLAYLNPLMTRTIADDYDLVVHIDTDIVVCDRLDEILEGDYDVAVARNNADQGSAGCGTPHNLYGNVDVFKYANAGIVASTKKEFWDDWVELNQKNFNKYPMHEQDNLNELLSTGKYDVKWLDPPDAPLYYNIASAYGDVEKWNGRWDKHWESWERIELKDGKLWLDNKLIKMLHYAGGNTPDKFNLTKHFSDEVTEHLKDLCNIPRKFAGE